MSGVTLRDGELVVERSANELDELAIDVSRVLSELGIEHVFIAGYLAILTGRARSTEDIDVIVERLSEEETTRLVGELEDRNYWGPAMSLTET
jgi:predicted nucleotidyltransferase